MSGRLGGRPRRPAILACRCPHSPALAAGAAILALACPPAALAQRPASAVPASLASATLPRLDVIITPSSNQPAGEKHALPFADHPVAPTYPSYSLSVGAGGYVSSFAGVTNAFHAAEDEIRAQGYALPSAGDVSLGLAICTSLEVSFTPRIVAALQFDEMSNSQSGTPGSRDELYLAGVLVSGRYGFGASQAVSVLGGLGGGLYGFSFERQYGSIISAVDASGGYTTLDYLRFQGGDGFWTVAGRIEARTNSVIGFEGTIQYFGMRDISTSAQGVGPISLNLSGALLSASFKLFF